MIRISLSTLIAFLLITQNLFTQCVFSPPVDYAIQLSGTFGELRGNHFHTGIDIKSPNGSGGHIIRAIADGYIHRIKIDAEGYGNSLYINHPCGMTSVYAHLNSFEKKIDSTIMAFQYSSESFEIDTLLSDSLFIVHSGDVIGFMGTTGYSFGPHLHFEIRNSVTERPLNPLSLAWKVQDEVAPRLQNLYIYSFNNELQINLREKIQIANKANKKAQLDTIHVSSRYIGIGLEAFDGANNISNKNGVYSLSIGVDNDILYKGKFDSLDFNFKDLYFTQVDHELKIKNRKNTYRCFYYARHYPNIITDIRSEGIFSLDPYIPSTVYISLSDYFGNQSQYAFVIVRDTADVVATKNNDPLIVDIQKAKYVDFDVFGVFIDSFSFEKPENIAVGTHADSSQNIMSEVYEFGRRSQTLLKQIKLHFKLNALADSIKYKLFISTCENSGYVNVGGDIEGEYLVAWVNQLGKYCLMIDTIPPSIQPRQFSLDWNALRFISFNIADNYPDQDAARPLKIEAYLDDKWILIKYDKKNDLIHYDFDHRLTRGEHRFELRITDPLGNANTFIKNISY